MRFPRRTRHGMSCVYRTVEGQVRMDCTCGWTTGLWDSEREAHAAYDMHRDGRVWARCPTAPEIRVVRR